VLGLSAPHADGYIYWATFQNNSIGRANVDGSDPDINFIFNAGGRTCGVAVDSAHVYWANYVPNGMVRRANLDGSSPEVFVPGGQKPCGVAVDSQYIYWANDEYSGSGGSIGRANLDGSDVRQDFIPNLDQPCGVAVDSGHIYWGSESPFTGSGYVGRADIDGSNSNPVFIGPDSDSSSCGIAVDSGHIYWATYARGGPIGRASLDGTTVEAGFIGALDVPCGVAVDSGSIYWAQQSYPGIGKANLDGTQVNRSLVFEAGSGPCGIAVDGLRPSNQFHTGKLERNKRRGFAKLPVTTPGPGAIDLRGGFARANRGLTRAVAPIHLSVAEAGTALLRVGSTGKAKRRLSRKGKIKVKVTVVFDPLGNDPRAETRVLKLLKKRPKPKRH
jgi:hypothetical protein